MDKIDYVIEIIKKDWTEGELVSAWNARCDAYNDYDSVIEYMDSFNDLMSGREPMEIAEMVCRGEFHSGDEFFAFNGYGNIHTFSYADDDYSPFGYFDLAEYLIEKGDNDTKEVDKDNLIEYFKDYFVGGINFVDPEKLDEAINYVIEEESYNLLTDDWDTIEESVKERLDEMDKNKKD